MARLEFFVISRSAAVDQATNAASIFEVIDEVNTPVFPSAIFQCVATTVLRREPGDENEDFQLLLRVTTPGGQEISTPANFRLTAPRHRLMARMEGVPVEQEGSLRFEVLLNGEHVAEHVVDVNRVESDSPDESTGGPSESDDP